jgi:MFS family permease
LSQKYSGLAFPLLYAVSFGLGFGSRPSMDAATASDIFRGRYFGILFGVIASGLGIGNLMGPTIGGIVHDLTGSYTAAFLFCLVAVIVATGCIWLAAPRRGRERALT